MKIEIEKVVSIIKLAKNVEYVFFQDIRNIDDDCNWTRTQNHLVRKRTLNHLGGFTIKRVRDMTRTQSNAPYR